MTFRDEKGKFIKGLSHPFQRKEKILVTCKCGTNFLVFPYRVKTGKQLSCSYSCARKGRKNSEYQKNIARLNGYKNKGKSHTAWNKGLIGFNTGEKNGKWIKDRSLVKVTDREHNNPRYKQWKREVHTRDKWKCRVNNADCNGRLEAHHILPWSKSPELRYEVNNGITLCHYHHPRSRETERKFAPTFQEMVLRPTYELAI